MFKLYHQHFQEDFRSGRGPHLFADLVMVSVVVVVLGRVVFGLLPAIIWNPGPFWHIYHRNTQTHTLTSRFSPAIPTFLANF